MSDVMNIYVFSLTKIIGLQFVPFFILFIVDFGNVITYLIVISQLYYFKIFVQFSKCLK